jgi:hypothetical protein
MKSLPGLSASHAIALSAYLMAATTGLRCGEMMEIERADVRLDETESKIVDV